MSRWNWGIITKMVIAFIVVFLAVYTVVAMHFAPGQEISSHVRDYTTAYPILSVAFGFVLGHWNSAGARSAWRMTGSDRAVWVGILLLTVLVTGSVTLASLLGYDPPRSLAWMSLLYLGVGIALGRVFWTMKPARRLPRVGGPD